MTIRFTCPHCEQRIEAPAEAVGLVLSCPTCNNQFHVGPSPPSQLKSPDTPPEESKKRTARKVLLFSTLGCGGIVTLILVILIAAAIFADHSPTAASPRIEDVIAALCQTGFNENKQKIFDGIHPVGTAKSVTVHDVTVTVWKHGQATNRFEDVEQFTVRYTLYWEGPVTTDGYTKITQTFDAETQRYVGGQILATNGITNENVNKAMGYIGGMLLRKALEGN